MTLVFSTLAELRGAAFRVELTTQTVPLYKSQLSYIRSTSDLEICMSICGRISSVLQPSFLFGDGDRAVAFWTKVQTSMSLF